MTWELEYLPEAITDLASLDNSIRQPVIKGIKKFKRTLFPRKKADTVRLLGIRKEII